jgi:hypothetical protein
MSVLVANLEERPHLEALRRAAGAGFKAWPMGDLITARRERGGIVEMYTVVSLYIASAGRWHESDFPHGGVLWSKSGSVADVITELLDLPRHGERGAPHLVQPPVSDLWTPGQ